MIGILASMHASDAKGFSDVRDLTGTGRDREKAAYLALVLGDLGAHEFYLGRPWYGVLMLIFFWTLVPAIIGFIQFWRFQGMTDEEFQARFG